MSTPRHAWQVQYPKVRSLQLVVRDYPVWKYMIRQGYLDTRPTAAIRIEMVFCTEY